jgi:hypothetical protein
MRRLLLAVNLTLVALGAFGQESSKSNVSQLPDGTLSGDTYTNDAVGLSYQFPNGWAATPDPKGPTTIDPRGSKKVANQCSKVLLRLSPLSKTEGRFSATAILIAIDPSCLGAPTFPQSLEQTDEIVKVAEKIGKSFNYTPFLSPYGNTVHPLNSQGRVIIQLLGGLVINALERPANSKEPLDVKTSFTFTEANGRWVAWAYTADDPSTEELKNVKVMLKDAPPR